MYSWICEEGKARTHAPDPSWKDRECFKIYQSPLGCPTTTTTTTFSPSLKLSRPIKSLSHILLTLYGVYFFPDFLCLHVSNITSLSLSLLFLFVCYSSFIPSLSLSFASLFSLPHIDPHVINLHLSPLVSPHCISNISTSCYFLLPPLFSSVSFTLYLLLPADSMLYLWCIPSACCFFPFMLSHLSLLVYLMYKDPGLLTHIEAPNT